MLGFQSKLYSACRPFRACFWRSCLQTRTTRLLWCKWVNLFVLMLFWENHSIIVFWLLLEFWYLQRLDDECVPGILHCPLERIFLQAKLFDMGEPKALLALCLDPPDLTNLENTVLLLKEVSLLCTAVYQLCVRVYIWLLISLSLCFPYFIIRVRHVHVPIHLVCLLSLVTFEPVDTLHANLVLDAILSSNVLIFHQLGIPVWGPQKLLRWNDADT